MTISSARLAASAQQFLSNGERSDSLGICLRIKILTDSKSKYVKPTMVGQGVY
jgi:hypothetical protein